MARRSDYRPRTARCLEISRSVIFYGMESSLREATSNAYATLASNLALFGGGPVAPGPGERRGDPRRRGGRSWGRDDAFARCLGRRRSHALGGDRYAYRAAGGPCRAAYGAG